MHGVEIWLTFHEVAIGEELGKSCDAEKCKTAKV